MAMRVIVATRLKYLKGVCGCLACQVLLVKCCLSSAVCQVVSQVLFLKCCLSSVVSQVLFVKCCFSSADYQVLYFKYFCGFDSFLSTVRVVCLG